MIQYNKRTWLNPDGNPSTASVVSFVGKTKWRDDLPPFDNYYLEIADCNTKIRLHKTAEETKEEWVAKLRKLRNHLDEYLQYLES